MIKQKLLNLIHNITIGTTFGVKRSSKWNSVRKEFIKQNPQCAFCNDKDDLEVHHIIPVHIDPESELNTTNLITLCNHDHFVIGHFCSWFSYNETVKDDCLLFKSRIQQRPN